MNKTRKQLSRTLKALPQLILNPDAKDLFAFTYDDIRLQGYVADSGLKALIAV